MLSKIRIRQHERGLRFRFGDFVGLLAPGEYRLWTRLISHKRCEVQIVNTLETRFRHELIDMLVKYAFPVYESAPFLYTRLNCYAQVTHEKSLECSSGCRIQN